MKSRQNVTPAYSLMQGLYWMAFCAVIGFVTVYLRAEGSSAKEIGILIAVSNIGGALLQPVAAGITDRLSLRKLIMISALAGAVMSTLLFLSDGILTLILYSGLVALLHVIMPLMNAIGMAYCNETQHCDFGFARAMGSLGFAVISYILGSLVDTRGVWTIAVTAGLLFFLLFFVMFSAKEPELSKGEDPLLLEGIGKGPSLLTMGRIYPGFILVILGVFLIYGFHNITNIYLIQMMEHVGGSAREMGITIGLAAVMELPAMVFFTKLQKRLGSGRILQAASMFWVVKSVGYLLAGRVGHIYGVQIFQALSFAPFTPGTVYYTDELMADRDKVRGQAFMAGANTLGGVLGSLTGGFFLDLAGVKAMLLFSAGLAGAGAAAVIRGTSKSQNSELADTN